MKKSPEAFRTISEVADWLDVPTHVLRFWESRFSQVKPVKRAGGRRYYRPNDMLLIGGIKALLHDEGMTIRGVQKLLREEGVKHVAGFSKPLDSEEEPLEAAAEETVQAESAAPEDAAAPEMEPAGTEDEAAEAARDIPAEAEVLSLVRAVTGGAEGDAADAAGAEPDTQEAPAEEPEPETPAVPLFGSRRAAEPELPFSPHDGADAAEAEPPAPADGPAVEDASAPAEPAETAADEPAVVADPGIFVAEGVPETDPEDDDPRYARGAGIAARLIAQRHPQIAPPPGTSIEDVVARLRAVRDRLEDKGA